MAVPVIEQGGESHEANVTSLDGAGIGNGAGAAVRSGPSNGDGGAVGDRVKADEQQSLHAAK